MNKKIRGISVCVLLMATTVPAVESLKNSAINPTVPNAHLTSMVTNWTEIQKLLASDGMAWDDFGWSVSLSGDTALIGARGAYNFNGSAYVFTRTSTTWTQQAKLLASDGAMDDGFGDSVSLSNDTALIGAPSNVGNGNHSGAAYVFTRTGTTWTQQQKLISSDSATGDEFGGSVSLSNDTALIGAPSNVGNGNHSGAAYVFTRNGATWSQQAKLTASDGAQWDSFGACVSLARDTALIGTHNYSETYQGSAYVFTRTGITWTQQQKLLTSNGTAGDQFGVAVALSGDTALIGAVLGDGNEPSSGSAYVFTRTGTTWTRQQKLIASDGAAIDGFGISVSLYRDTALIGACWDDDNGGNSGSAYVFTRTGTTWTQQQKLLASEGAAIDVFGRSVSLSGDTALIGAPYDNDNGDESGSAYVFKGPNQPPSPPTINGPSRGLIKVNYSFYVNVTDPDADNIYCKWDWGDGNITDWLGSYSSGDMVCVSHAWSQVGTYEIRVKLKDDYGQESNWSDSYVFNAYEEKKTFMFGRYTNLTVDGGFITVEAVNLWTLQFRPYVLKKHISPEKITFSSNYVGIKTKQFIIGIVDVVI